MRPASEARAIIEEQYQALLGSSPPWRATRLLLAQSRGEGRWGAFGGTDAAGDYYDENWGAVQAKMGPPCPPWTFEHGDSKPTADGQVPFRWCFLGYPSASDGARDFLKHALVYRPSAAVAVLTGNPQAYATALYGNGKAPYFGGFGATVPERIQSYVTFLESNAREVDRELGLPPPAIDVASTPATPTRPGSNAAPRRGPGILLAAAVAAAAAFIMRQ